MNRIEYGDGDISINIGDSVIGFDIILGGTYELESYDVPNFLISYNNNRIIGVGLGSKLGVSPFLKYTGDLKILNCTIVNDEMKKINIYPTFRYDHFRYISDNFDGVNTKFEDLNQDNVNGKIPRKTKVYIITKNQHTKGGQYTLNKNNYIGDYHLHHNGIAMTGKEHTEYSEILEITDIKKRKRKISQTIRTARKTGGGY